MGIRVGGYIGRKGTLVQEAELRRHIVKKRMGTEAALGLGLIYQKKQAAKDSTGFHTLREPAGLSDGFQLTSDTEILPGVSATLYLGALWIVRVGFGADWYLYETTLSSIRQSDGQLIQTKVKGSNANYHVLIGDVFWIGPFGIGPQLRWDFGGFGRTIEVKDAAGNELTRVDYIPRGGVSINLVTRIKF